MNHFPGVNGLRQLARAALVFVLVQAASIAPAVAATFTVTKTADTNDGACNADCSLREAIVAANTAAGADQIVFQVAGLTYTLSLGGPDGAGLIVPGSGDLDITQPLTIEGNGSTVSGGATPGAGIDRVFDIQGAIAVTINNLTITNGRAQGPLSLGGGLNIRGGATVVLNNCLVTSNNTALEGPDRDSGGGIAAVGSFSAATGVTTLATLTLNSTTVSNNSGSVGGGILCVLCALTTANATLKDNISTVEGGGLAWAGNASTGSMTGGAITGNTVTGGAARGGALSLPVGTGSGTFTLTRARIVSNTATTGGGVYNNAATVSAQNDWWGCNFGPGTSGTGCPTAPNSVSGTVTTSPFLILKTSASPGSVLPGGTAVLTADLTFNSSSADTSAGGTIPGTLVNFTATLGAFAPTSSTTTNGKVTSTYTACGCSGVASLSAIVDGQTVSSAVPVGTPPAIATQPQNQTVATSQPVTLSVAATGSPTLVYQWYIGASGTTTSPIASATSSTYTAPSVSSMTNYWVRVSSLYGVVDSTTATISVAGGLGIFRPGAGRWLIAGQPDTDWGAPGDIPVRGDYNGDHVPDIAVFRPANGTWYIKDGATIVWGAPGDIPVPADYNGDGTTDIAVFRPSAGMFYIRNIATIAWGVAGDLPVVADYDGDHVADVAVYRPSTGTWYIRNIATEVYGLAADIPVPADYNGDGLADIAVFRRATGTWFVKDQYTQVWGAGGDIPVPLDRDADGHAELGIFRRASGTWYFKNHVTDGTETVSFGATGDLPLGRALPAVQMPWGDYDGDRRADLTVFRPSTGDWISLRSLSGMTDYTLRTFGLSSDLPVGRDYDGDGKFDPAVYRPSLGRWLLLQSSTNYSAYVTQDFGLSTDMPVAADYDGDGKADIAVYRPSIGRWVILLSSSNNTSSVQYDWGVSGDIPVPADYDGDGRVDIAVYRPSLGRWYILNRFTGTFVTQDWGVSGDVPIAADFDGDGKADLAAFRPSFGRWFVKSSIDGTNTMTDWGLSGDAPVPADYDGDGKADIAVFRPSTGTWYVRGLFNQSWGLAGDIPALKNP